jgi:hypothetical protein
LRSQDLSTYSRISQHVMEPKGSLPYPQEPATLSILSQMDPVYASIFFLLRSILTLPSRLYLWLPRGLLASDFPTRNLYVFLFSTVHATCPAHLYHPLLDQSNYIWRGIRNMKLFIKHSSHPPITSSLLGPNTFLSTLFINILRLCSSLSIRDQVSHLHKTTG